MNQMPWAIRIPKKKNWSPIRSWVFTLLHDPGSDLAGQIFLEAGAPHVAPRVVGKDDPKKKTWETLLVGWHTTSWVEKQGVGVGVGGDEEIRFLSFVCVLEIMGNSSISIINFIFFSSYSRMGLALEDFRFKHRLLSQDRKRVEQP